jgi:hypothetical protein
VRPCSRLPLALSRHAQQRHGSGTNGSGSGRSDVLPSPEPAALRHTRATRVWSTPVASSC